MEKLKVFEAFSGIGTQHMALKRLGIPFEIVAISEIDEAAIKSYEAIHGKANNLGDIINICEAEVPDHDLFTYSFPCQDLSKEGMGKGMKRDSGTRSSLLWEGVRIVEHKKPKYLLAENIKNIISKKYIEDFNTWLAYLDKIGYNTYHKVVNSIGYIPQNRERVFIVSIRKDIDNGLFEFPNRLPTETKLIDILDVNREKYFISKILEDKLIWRNDGDFIARSSIKIRNATTLGYALAEHGDGIELAYATSKTRRGRVQKNRSQTLTTSPTAGILLNENGEFLIRNLTPLEYWRLMDIEDEDFKKAEAVVKEYQLYSQAGNSIVVGVLEDIFRNLFTNTNYNDII